ncbi:MAG TPA: DUF502 domain-containing protein [Parvularculaceae bacterium]|nr:DUF502 domain-containing protein [Parvularculaceae bacterium]
MDDATKPEDAEKTSADAPGEKPVEGLIKPAKQSFLANLRSSFLAGVVVVAPIGITAAIVYWFVTGPMANLDSFVRKALPGGGSNFDAIIHAIPGVGVLIAIVAIVLLGAFAKNFVGRAFIRAGEELLDSMPVVRTLYRFFKNVFETALQQSARSFKEVALVEYPRPGAWALAFVVGDTRGEIEYRLSDQGERLTSVFVPTVPNPTSGFLLFVPRKSLRTLTMTVEDAAKTVFSIGLVTPAFDNPDDAVKRLEEMAAEARESKWYGFRLPMPGRKKAGHVD